jgi:hypothetical protein
VGPSLANEIEMNQQPARPAGGQGKGGPTKQVDGELVVGVPDGHKALVDFNVEVIRILVEKVGIFRSGTLHAWSLMMPVSSRRYWASLGRLRELCRANYLRELYRVNYLKACIHDTLSVSH